MAAMVMPRNRSSETRRPVASRGLSTWRAVREGFGDEMSRCMIYLAGNETPGWLLSRSLYGFHFLVFTAALKYCTVLVLKPGPANGFGFAAQGSVVTSSRNRAPRPPALCPFRFPYDR